VAAAAEEEDEGSRARGNGSTNDAWAGPHHNLQINTLDMYT